ncbi:MAG: hypothetical protein JWL73_486 [Actinomycetia bacterium]|nr:hypothetical protein [Actinomycetes bacterium]
MPRRDISMSAGEIDAFLAANREAVVAATHVDGGTLATVAGYEFGDGALTLRLRADDPVLAALRVDNRACVTVEQFPSYSEIRAVVAHGHVTTGDVAADDSVEVALPLGADTVSFDFAKQAFPT